MNEARPVHPKPTGVGDLLALMRDGQPRTRADLVAATGQARTTIASKLDALGDLGLITPTGGTSSTGGRPAVSFVFASDAACVLAVDLGARHAHFAITDLAARILAERDLPIDIKDGPDAVLSVVAEQATALMREAERPQRDLARVGIGLPGPVDHATGRPTNPPIMPGWDGADVPGLLSQALGVPVLADNDVNIMAVGEQASTWPQVDNLFYVKVATGIGGGVIVNRQLCRGAQGTAGDLGHVAVAGHDARCACGNTGCLEAVASGQAIADALRAKGLPAADSTEVVALVRAGNTEARLAVREAGRVIGSVLATCVSLLNPSVIVIGGELAQAGEELLAGIRERVYARALPLASQDLRIVTSSNGVRAGILGAAIIAREDLLSPAAIDRAVAQR